MEYLKMSELVEKTGVQKSTILFYLKEGLLPEPQRPKPNVYRYHPKTVEVINYIKYMQQSLGSPIADIKECFSMHNLTEDSTLLLTLMEQLSGAKHNAPTYNRAQFLEKTGLDETALAQMEAKEILVPVKPDLYNDRDVEVAVLHKKMLTFDESDRYELAVVKAAKALAELEFAESERIFAATPQEQHGELHRLLIELVLTAKPYLFQRHTMRRFDGNHPAKKGKQ